jgi:hypothetical protein
VKSCSSHFVSWRILISGLPQQTVNMYELTGRAAWFTFRVDQTGSLRQARRRMVGRSVHKVQDRIYVELGTERGRSGRIIDTVLNMCRGRI